MKFLSNTLVLFVVSLVALGFFCSGCRKGRPAPKVVRVAPSSDSGTLESGGPAAAEPVPKAGGSGGIKPDPKALADAEKALRTAGDAESFLSASSKFEALGLLDRAMGACEEALKKNPYATGARERLLSLLFSRAVVEAENPEASEALLTRALGLAPADERIKKTRASVETARGFSSLGRGERTEAVGHFESALATWPDSVEALKGKAKAHLAGNEIVEAAEAARKALLLSSGDEEALRIAAQVDIAAGDLTSATSILQKIPVPDGPGSSENDELRKLLLEKGEALLRERKYQEAAEAFGGAERLGRAADLSAKLGAALLGAGNVRAALKAAEEALVLDPQCDEAHFLKGDALALNQDPASALESYSAPLAYSPAAVEPRFRAARLLTKMNRIDEAKSHLEQILVAEPDNIPAAEQLGILKARSGDFEGATTLWEQIRARHPEYPNVHYDIALLNMKRGDFDEAIVNYSKASELAPDNALYLYSLGLAYRQKGLIDESIAAWKRVLEVAPGSKYAGIVREMIGPESSRKNDTGFDDVKKLHNQAVICERLGKREELVSVYLKILSVSPSDKKANLEMAREFSSRGEKFESAACLVAVGGINGKDDPGSRGDLGEALIAAGAVRAGMSLSGRGASLSDVEAMDPAIEAEALESIAGILEKRCLPARAGEIHFLLGKSSGKPESLRKAAELFAAAEEFDLASRAFKLGLKVAPDDRTMLTGLGIIVGFKGDVDEACRLFDRAVELDPLDFGVYLSYAGMLQKARQNERAEMVLQRMLNLSPPENDAAAGKALLDRIRASR